jgi:hypothetical protein
MTFCKGGCGKTTSGPDRLRCRVCARKMAPLKRKKKMPAGTKEWNQTFTQGPRTKFGKDTTPAGCGFSWWAEKPEQFYDTAHERALALRGQGSSE